MSLRLTRFLLALVVGLALGLLYGWVINPVKYVDTTPDSLHQNYKTDIVLMAAEGFQGDGDLALAGRRLAMLGGSPPLQIVEEAIQAGKQEGYAAGDLDVMARLAAALRTWTPVPTRSQP